MKPGIKLSPHWSYNIANDPKRLAFVLARYRFASEMACRGRSVLELGCSEAIGLPILASMVSAYCGVDLDEQAIAAANENWVHSPDKSKDASKVDFRCDDFLGKEYGTFGAVISLDVVEHIDQDIEPKYWQTIHQNLHSDGICVVGTPNATASAYASPASQVGHINLFDGNRLKATMEKYFKTVFLFGMNDELVHTGYTPMSHYLFAVACNRRVEPL